MKKQRAMSAFVAATFFGFTGVQAWADPMAMDQPVQVGNQMAPAEVVCTGIGDAKDDPRWPSYPIRVEFSNGGAQYLAGAHVTLELGGKVYVTPSGKHRKHKVAPVVDSRSGTLLIASFDCLGSWVLLKVPAGTYTVAASLMNTPGPERSATFATTGQPPQKRVEIQFPLAANQ